MGEALISRAGGGGDAEQIIPITPGYHTILATVRTDKGTPMVEYPVSCLDGSSQYNYSTNEKGQVMFTCNSGSANIFISNQYNGHRYIDFSNTWSNNPAPIGLTSRVNINLAQCVFSEFTSSGLFKVSEDRMAENIILVGGGGGGSGQWYYQAPGDDYSSLWKAGGGGAGYLNQYNQVSLIKNNLYNFVAGAGGSGGNYNRNGDYRTENGYAGGTSYIVNTDMSAQGGSGGRQSRGGTGGLGSGGNTGRNGANSSVNFAGGGGGGGTNSYDYDQGGYGGWPYGGNGGQWDHYASSSRHGGRAGTRGGGGGGAAGNAYTAGGPGGVGLCRINLSFD